jgi:hypothetical protein
VAGKVNPPLRGAEHVEALWARLGDGTVDVLGSDHCPYTRAAKGTDLWAARAGIPGGSAMILPILLTEGVGRRGMTLSRVVALTSYNAARLFGLYPQKGALEVGSDADLVIVDPDREMKVNLAALRSAVDYSPWDGYVARGWPAVTIAGGEIVYEDGEIVAERPRARILPPGGADGMPALTFGVMFRPGQFSLSHVTACLRVAEDVGFDHAWFGDSHLIWHETGPWMTAAALATTRMRVGPLVANPVTRHPTVVASSLATVAQLFDGRAALGLGRGDSAVRTLGLAR